ncbi:tandem large repeat, partial [Vibrio campbellii]
MAASLLLSACGGGDGGDNTPPARNTGSISGNVFDAPVNGAKIDVFEYKDGKVGRKLDSTTSDAFGDYKLEFESSSMPLYVVAQQGSYTDPLTKEIVSSSANKTLRLEGIVNFSEGSDQKLMLTPLTNIVSGLAKYKIANGESGSDAVSEALDSINGMYGFNVNETKPIDITKGGQSSFATPGHQYGALLTAYSSYSYDLIQKYGQSEDKVYTSMHFADIQFRDVIADGLLDGLEISESTGAVTPLTFGQQRITSDVYTQDLSQHVLIVVNDPELNISGTDADDYVAFSQKINDLGSHGETDGVIPPRDETEIDTVPPTITRTDNDVLTKTDNVDIRLNDDIGVQSVSAYVQYQLNGVWSDEFKCNDQQTSGSEFCTVDASGFEVGVRETNIKVSVDTKAIDAVEVDSDTGLSNVTAARLVFYTADVLGNELIPGSNSGHYVNFEWDNDAPVISVTSASAINNELQEYVLKGIVKEASQDIKSVSVSFKSGLPEDVACTPVTAESGSACEFSKAYSTDEFLSTTTFDVRATDTKDNVGEYQHAVSRDDQAPAQIITYPEGTSMNYVNVTVDGERSTYEGVYTQDTYTSDNVQSSRDYLKIDYVYAASGLKSIDGVDFANFNVNLLKQNKIPYVRVRVADVNSDTVLGSSADKLKLVVKYYVSQNNDNNYAFQNTTQTVASTDTITASIPHETILDSEGRVDEVIYYVPFVKEVLGDGFKNVSENASQKLVIQTIDESDNESATQEVYFRSSFDLPTMTVVTPFIGARVQLEGLNPNGEFTSLASCTTIQQPESDQTTALDVASCETTTDVVNYEFMRVRLIGVEGTDPHYYQWKDDAGAKASVNLNNANIGAYFELDGSNTYYVTELATYQTGLFDYRWNQVEAGDKTSERASQILTEVKYALAGGNDSFFGFDPTVTAYATNEMLEEPIPSDLSNDYLHRFLVEAIDDLAQDTPRNNSSDFASAIYDDLSYDGKANGIGAGGNQIKLDDYEFDSDTYRKDLAQSYYDIMTEKYGIPDNIAQLYADDISTANPKLGEDNIFDSGGGSIDIYPPKQTLTIETGRETMVGDKLYVAGEVVSRLVLEDPSGVVEEGDQAPKFQSMWYAVGDPNTAIPLELQPQESGDSDKFRKEYFFTLNTESADLTDIIEFALETTAFDTKGNGYTEADPLVERLYVDNDYPEASYIPPIGPDKNPIGEDVYLSIKNNIHDLTFELKDVVGDKLEKRSLLFYKTSGERYPVSYDQFYTNQSDRFVVRLCSQEDCSTQGTTINPGDGDWLTVVSAEDNLGNAVSDADNGASRFRIYIDSEPPVVNDAEISERLGGNDVWTPVIDWGDLSQGSNVKVELRKGSGQSQTLEACDPETSVCDQPYLIGEQPDVKVQLVAEAFNYDSKNEFYVTATDKAYPANESRKGTFSFQVDNKGPVVLLSTPWIEDALNKENTVVGRKFNVLFESVTDDSGIEEISLFQVDNPTVLKTFKPADPSQKFEMPLVDADTDKIDLREGEGNRISLYVKAKDVHGFESQSNTNSVIFDNKGPEFSLMGHDVNSYYNSDYVFELRATDLGPNGNVSTEGVDRENLEYWIFEDVEPAPGTPGTKIVNADALKIPLGGQSDGEHTIRVKGSDTRGNSSTKDFLVNVSSKRPQLDLTIAYTDSGDLIERVIYEEGDIKLTLKVTDVSGVKEIKSTYKYSGESKATDFQFYKVDGSEDTWEATLTQSQLSTDGNYELSISVENNVQHNGAPLITDINRTLSVQRNGVALEIAEPNHDFQNYVSDGVLDVTFKTLSEVKAKSIECWVRKEHNGNDAPTSGEKPTSGVKNISSGQEPSCSVDSENISYSPAVLIVQTTGTNGAEAVQKFDFKMMDADVPAPVYPESDTYQFKGGEVTYDLDDPTKYLAFDLIFKDELSGVNITDNTDFPKLIRMAGSIPFSAESCVLNAKGEAVCRYKEKYADIIQKTAVTHAYKISNITDNAGNLAAEHEFEFLLPTEKPVVEITSPERSDVLNGKILDVDFRVKLAEYSDIENVSVTFGSLSYDLKNNADNFRNFTTCSDDDTYRCSTFHSDELDAGLENKALSIEVLVTDVWENRGLDLVEDIRFDNTAPVIGDAITVTEQADDKVRFTFVEMKDDVSGLARVKYTVRALGFEEEKTENMTYFELSKDQLLGRDQITVEVIATDAVDNQSSEDKVIDLSKPAVALSFDHMTSLLGGKLAFTKESQSFTITSTEGEYVKATHYSIDMVPTTGDPLNFNGNIVSSSATGTMDFAIDDQAEYIYKVTVTDSMGRAIKDFTLFNNTYNAEGIASVVDYEDPEVSIVDTTQDDKATDDGKYQLDVTAQVTDKNLSSVTSTADNGSGLAVGPQSITEPTNDGEPYVFHYLLSPGNYTIKVIANDAVGNQKDGQTIYEVVAATVPELTISTTASTPLAGGVEVPLTFTFTEEVTEFDISDVKLDENNGGELKPLSWSTIDNITWTVRYITPERENIDITIRVDDGSYKSINNIPGKGDSLILGVEGVLPTLTKVTFDPLHQEIGKAVDVKLEFDKELQEATATLGANNVTSLTADPADKKVWTGTVNVPDVPELGVGLVVSQYKDLVGNVGEDNTSYTLPITPTLTVENIGDVNETGAESVAVSGDSTRFETSDELTIKAVDTDNKEVTQTTTVTALGKWNATLDVSGLKDGTITVTVNGTNDLGAPAKEAGTTFTLTQTKPTVDDAQTSINPTYAAAGDSVTVTATFDKGVTTPTGSTLGTAAINWTAQSGTHTQWVGTAEVASVADSVKSVALTLQGFNDATGNTGEVFTSSKELVMTPTLTVENIGDVNEAGAASVAVSGDSTRFETSDELTIKAVDTDNKEVTQTTTVTALGKWNAALDVSGLKDGTITVTVNGTNDLGAPAKEAGTTFTLTQTKPTVDDAQTSINPTYAAAGESVTVTATFDKGVTTPTGSTLGTAAINWTAQSGTQTQWVGTAEVASVADSVKSVALTLQGFNDATGNAGEVFTSSKELVMIPTLTVENIGDVNEASAASVAVSGDSTRFETSDTLTIKAVDTDNKEVTQTTTVTALGKWNAALDVSGLKDGTITVTVNGTNDLGAPAKEAGTTFTLTQTKPTVDDSQTSINPTYAAAGESVTVTATFDKGVTTPTGSTLGTAAINWTAQSGTQTQWVGTAEVASVADSVKSVALTLQGFNDATGNAGEAFTSSKELVMTPTLTVENIGDVNEAGAASVAVSGDSTRFETSDELTIKAVDTDNKEVTQTTTVTALGKWNATLDVSGLKDGTITVTVNGTNDLGAPAKEAGTTFTLTQTKPTVDDSQTSINPTYAAAGESVTVTATFDKGVTTPTGSTLGTAVINWTAQSGTQTQWVGTAEVASVADSVKSVALTLQGFSDATGNAGEAFTSSKELVMTPTLTVENIGDVNEAGAASVAVSGDSTRFESTDTLTIKAVDTDNKEVTQTTTVTALGKWNATLDVSGLKDGTITVTVNGTNDLGAPAKEAGTTFTLTQTKPTVDDGQTSINPTYAAVGESVTVTATFDKGVTTPTGSTLGTAAINWTAQSGTHTQWVGTAEVASVADSVKSVALTLRGFNDATGNAGEAFTSSKELVMTPTLTVVNIGDVNEAGAASVAVSGDSTRFETSDELTIKAVDTDNKEVTQTTTVTALGKWNATLDVSGLKDGTITVTVNGTNDLGAPAKEAGTTFTLTQTKPTVDDSQTSINPTYAAAGESVTVTATFDKGVTTPTGSTLGTAAINWTAQSGTQTQWVGTAEVASVADSVKSVALTLQGFNDATGNAGEAFTSSKELVMIPTLTVENIGDVNEAGAASVAVSGDSTRFETSDTLTIKAVDTDNKEVTQTTTVTALGKWNTTLDVSGLKDGTITVTVNGTNDLGAPAKEAGTTFTLTQTKPTVDDSQTSINPTYAAAGESVTVTATFDKGVTTPTGSTLGTAAINWTAQAGTQTQWVGTAEVASVADSVKSVALTLRGFNDATGNAGEAFTSSKELVMTPTLTVENIGDVNEASAASVAVSGDSTRFESTDTLTIKAVDTDNKEVTQTTTVTALGKWNAALDVSGLKDGTITVTVNGTNDLEAPAKEAGTTFTLTQTKPTVDDGQTSINPTYAAAGESVTVTATFDKGVTTPTGSTLGT